MAGFGAVYCLYDDIEYLDLSLETVAPQLEKVLFLISEVPWNGRPSDNSAEIRHVEQLVEKHSNFELIRGRWTNEMDQRNFGLARFSGEGIDYCFIIDTDEIYHAQHFANIKATISANPQIAAFHLEWNTYWKKSYHRIEPREGYRPLVAVKCNSFEFNVIRGGTTAVRRMASRTWLDSSGAGYNGAIIPLESAVCYHLSYARNDDYMLRKLETNSHAPEFIKHWYDEVWLKWTPDARNLHPVSPAQYQMAVPEDLSNLPEHLRRFIEAESSGQS